MLIALFSDTHDNAEKIIQALDICRTREINTILHCGDLIAPMTLQFFQGFTVYFVRGNCDGDILNIKKNLEIINGHYLGDFGIVNIDNRKIALYHGNNSELLFAVSNLDVDIVAYGHTHRKNLEIVDKNNKKKIIINPGCFYNSKTFENSFAIINLETLEVEFVRV
ncbi:MAG: YfcE family phosphodiesterase [Candidatus Woesearchaeota archaeon]